jgi:hypothetical protein
MDQQLLIWKMPIRWENGLGGLGEYKRIFSCHSAGIFCCFERFLRNDKKKSVCIRPIRSIRSPIVSACVKICTIRVPLKAILIFLNHHLLRYLRTPIRYFNQISTRIQRLGIKISNRTTFIDLGRLYQFTRHVI